MADMEDEVVGYTFAWTRHGVEHHLRRLWRLPPAGRLRCRALHRRLRPAPCRRARPSTTPPGRRVPPPAGRHRGRLQAAPPRLLLPPARSCCSAVRSRPVAPIAAQRLRAPWHSVCSTLGEYFGPSGGAHGTDG